MKTMACISAFLVLAVAAATASAQVVDPNFPDTDGSVVSSARDGNTLYIGGSFTNAGGRSTGGFAAIDATTEAPASWPSVNGTVLTCISDGSGGWYLGGTFTMVGGSARTNLAHILSTGSVASWNPAPDDAVQCLALSGSTLYVGGAFLNIGGQARTFIAAVDANTGLATSWMPEANNYLFALALSGSNVYVGGQFATIGGQPRSRIAALDIVSGAATSWNPGADARVEALAIDGTTIYVADSSPTSAARRATSLARWTRAATRRLRGSKRRRRRLGAGHHRIIGLCGGRSRPSGTVAQLHRRAQRLDRECHFVGARGLERGESAGLEQPRHLCGRGVQRDRRSDAARGWRRSTSRPLSPPLGTRAPTTSCAPWDTAAGRWPRAGSLRRWAESAPQHRGDRSHHRPRHWLGSVRQWR